MLLLSYTIDIWRVHGLVVMSVLRITLCLVVTVPGEKAYIVGWIDGT